MLLANLQRFSGAYIAAIIEQYISLLTSSTYKCVGTISCYEKCSFRTETTLATMKLIKTHGVLALKSVTKN